MIASRIKSKLQEIENWSSNNLKDFVAIQDDVDSKQYNFESIVKADLATLMKLKEYIDINNISKEGLGQLITKDEDKQKSKYRYYIKDTLFKDMGGSQEVFNQSVKCKNLPVL